MKGHIRERAPGRWEIVLDLRDPLCTPVAALFRAEKPGPPKNMRAGKIMLAVCAAPGLQSALGY